VNQVHLLGRKHVFTPQNGKQNKMQKQLVHMEMESELYLHEVAEHGELSETAVLDLLHLQLSEGLWVISKAEGVEVLASCINTSSDFQAIYGQIFFPDHNQSALFIVCTSSAHERNLAANILQSMAGEANQGAPG
jgi:hypothetical protein